MIGYVTVGTNDRARSKAFYEPLMAEMGAKQLMESDRFTFYGTGEGAMLGVFVPYDQKEAKPGNGNMVALAMPSREKVDAVHAKAMELGAPDEGAPGERMPTFYGAYFRDPDGNKICVFKMG